MTDVIARGIAWLASAQRSSAAHPGVYRRKNGQSATLMATLGRSESEQTTDRNLVSVVSSDDILVLTADFEAAFGAGERPDSGDVWERDGRKYVVRPLGGEPAWRKSDPYGVRLRIHLKDEGPVL